ncbi:MAG: RDD family protein [Gammaproteobacteria bacterium]|nr:RDD family protein [Gammaproteobacteria bacterium]
MTYAGFWRRFGASIIDSVIFSVLISLLIGPGYANPNLQSPEGIISAVIMFGVTVALWVRYQGTPGKLLLACQVVNADTGEPIGYKQAVVRFLGYFVSLLTLFAGFIWIAWDKRKQGFHDKMANTVVVYNSVVDVFDESQKTLEQLISELR